jgi:ornithine cyclodeaminase
VAVDLLARRDAKVLALFGTGNQAYHEARAIALVRPLENVIVVGRKTERAAALADRLCHDGISARAGSAGEALGVADIVVTATTARAPLFEDNAVRSGTHISAMGADGPGKQELPAALLRRATLFADLPLQSLAIGEFQHLAYMPAAERIIAIAAVLCDAAVGRTDPSAITVYDSSGFGLQDLAIAALALERATAAGRTLNVEI